MEILDSTSPDILIVKNFFTEEEVRNIFTLLNLYGETEWGISGKEKKVFVNTLKDESVKSYQMLWDDMTIDITSKEKSKEKFPKLPYDFLIQKEFEIKKIVEKKFKEKVILHMSNLHRWGTGKEHKPHIDYYDSSEYHDFKALEQYNLTKDMAEKFEKILGGKHYSSLVYFNNDYIGGELHMPQWNWEIKPDPGMLIVFRGDTNHLHGVKKIERGSRYTWSIFWTRKDWAIKNNLDVLK